MSTGLRQLLVVTFTVLSSVAFSLQRPAPVTAGASLSGIVLEDATGQPIRQAIVSVFTPGDRRTNRLTSTDDEGRFRFDGLPVRPVALSATRLGFVTAYYGSLRAGGTVGVPIAVAPNAEVSGLELRLLRGAVISGSVRGATGQPLPSVLVRLGRVGITATGEKTVATAAGAPTATTDTRGAYRFFGLAPGEYIVFCDTSRIGVGLSGPVSRPTEAEFRWIDRLSKAESGLSPPPESPIVRFAPMFYPSTADFTKAGIVSVSPGSEFQGADILVQPVRTGRISGSTRDQNGAPLSVALTLVPLIGSFGDDTGRLRSADAAIMGGSVTEASGVDGSFSIRAVPPGRYSLVARTTQEPVVWASQDLIVPDADVDGVNLRLLPLTALMGVASLQIKGQNATKGNAVGSFGLRLMTTGRGGQAISLRITPAADGSFEIPRVVPGWYRLHLAVSEPDRLLQKATLGPLDVSDAEFEVRPGATAANLVITFDDSAAEVSGTLHDSLSRPTSDLYVMLFALDRKAWYQGSRRVLEPIRPATDGTFTFRGLPPGDYGLAALADLPPVAWYSADFLDQVVSAAVKVSVAGGEKRVQNIKVGSGTGR